jgi:hypothetical protein
VFFDLRLKYLKLDLASVVRIPGTDLELWKDALRLFANEAVVEEGGLERASKGKRNCDHERS